MFYFLVVLIGLISYVTTLWPHIVVPILIVVMLLTFFYVLWIFAKMITEED